MSDRKVNRNKRARPTVAPGASDAKFGEPASKEDIRKGNFTKVTRVYLDETDPS